MFKIVLIFLGILSLPNGQNGYLQTDDDQIVADTYQPLGPDSFECRSWLDCQRNRIKGIILAMAKFIKEFIKLIKEGAKNRTDIANTATDFSTELAHRTLEGNLVLSNKTVEAGTSASFEGTKLVNDNAVQTGTLGKLLQSGVFMSEKVIKLLSRLSNMAIQTTRRLGSSSIQTANNIVHKGNNFVNDVVQKGSDITMKVVNCGTKTIIKAIDYITDTIDSWFGKD